MNEALVILGIINVTTLMAFAYYIYLESKERGKTINALIAKNSQEYLNHEMADKTEKIKVEPNPDLREDLTALSDLTDQEFEDDILKQEES